MYINAICQNFSFCFQGSVKCSRGCFFLVQMLWTGVVVYVGVSLLSHVGSHALDTQIFLLKVKQKVMCDVEPSNTADN